MTQIDENYQGVGLAVEDDVVAAAAPLLVDPTTGRLLISIAYENRAETNADTKIDANFQGVAMAVTDDANNDIKPLKVNPDNNHLMVDILKE